MLGNLIPVLRPKDVAGDNVKNRDDVNEFLVRIRTEVITANNDKMAFVSRKDSCQTSGVSQCGARLYEGRENKYAW